MLTFALSSILPSYGAEDEEIIASKPLSGKSEPLWQESTTLPMWKGAAFFLPHYKLSPYSPERKSSNYRAFCFLLVQCVFSACVWLGLLVNKVKVIWVYLSKFCLRIPISVSVVCLPITFYLPNSLEENLATSFVLFWETRTSNNNSSHCPWCGMVSVLGDFKDEQGLASKRFVFQWEQMTESQGWKPV